MTRLAAISLIVLAVPALANAPDMSLRPVAREDVFPVALPSFAPGATIRPKYRTQGAAPASAATATIAAAAVRQPVSKPAPKPAPTSNQRARAAVPATGRDAVENPGAGATPALASRRSPSRTEASMAGLGRICKDSDLQGTVVGPVTGTQPGCGISSGAVKLHYVSGVKLSTPAVMECQTARALKTWVENGAGDAVGRYGGGILELKVAAGYACRTRNSRKGAKISEHGKGRAIDISAIVLQDGTHLSVLEDWGKGKRGRILKKAHKSACGPFGTVLGPNSDRHHQDHFHLDVAQYRNGAYCR